MSTVGNFTITLINQDNQSITLQGSNPSSYGLTAVQGLAATDYTQNINTNGNAYGGAHYSTKLSPRTIDLEFDIQRNALEQSNRLFLERFLSPLQYLDVVVSRLDTTRHIKCRVSSFDIEQAHLGASQLCQLSLIAPNPLLMDMSDYGQDIASVTGMFAPPFLMNTTTGQVMGVVKAGDLTTLTNSGDIDVGLTARFVARDRVENVKLFNARDPSEYVRVIETMNNSEVITISMMDGEKTIKKTVGTTTTNIINKLDRSSNFFKIKRGGNVIGFDADLGKNALEVWLNYTPLYFGI